MERTRSTLTNVVIAGIDRIRLRTFAAVASAVVLLFALIFNWLTANGSGLTGTGGENIGFAQSLYFSVVTFTSLGYGDIVPPFSESESRNSRRHVRLIILGSFMLEMPKKCCDSS
jgi:amino acid permease